MIIAAGTKNPTKVEGIRLAFARYYVGIKVRTIDSSSVTRAQPLGLDQMMAGAMARAEFAISKLGGDYGVGVEAGIFQIDGAYFDNQQAAIVDRTGKFSLGHSAGYPLPTKAVEEMIKAGKELERYAESLSGITEIGDKGGLVNHLTKGAMTRTDLTEQCVMMALIPWLQKEVYGY